MATATILATNQYLTFRLGAETYALDVANAREIVEYSAITQLPKTPDWMRGVINLRGIVLPVLDLKLKFGMGATERTVNTCAIVVEVILHGDLHVLGILADSVQEVFELEASQIEPPPRFGTRLSTKFIKGMGRKGDQLFIVLDAEKVLSGEEFDEVEQVSNQGDSEPQPESSSPPPTPASAPTGSPVG